MARPSSLIDLFLRNRKKAPPLITLDEGVPTVQLGDQFDVTVPGPEGDITHPLYDGPAHGLPHGRYQNIHAYLNEPVSFSGRQRQQIGRGVPTLVNAVSNEHGVQTAYAWDLAFIQQHGFDSPRKQRGQVAQAGVDKWFAQQPEGTSAPNKDQEGPTL